MAHVISLTDGTTTITLDAASGYRVLSYDIVTPKEEGGVMPADVAETLEYIVVGSSGAQVQTRIGAVDRLLETARRRNRWGVGPRVFIKLQVDGEASPWRAEIFGCDSEPQEDTLRLWPNNSAVYTLTLRRAAAWESDTLVQLALTNSSGTNNTTGLTVNNHDAGSADNYVQIAGANVGGNLPAPVQLEMTNNTGGSVNYYEILLASNAFSDPATLPHVLQAESAIVSGGGTVASDAACSNGQYVAWSFTGSNAQQYTLTQALLQDAMGYDFHLLARFRTVNARAFVRPSIYDATGTYALWSGDEVEIPLISPALVDLGVIPLPPGGYSAAWGAMRLRLDWRADTTVQVDTDFFAFFPSGTFHILRGPTTVANGGVLVDDGIEGRAYVRAGGVEQLGITPRGLPLLIWPNMTQRIYFAWSLFDWTAPISQALSVKVWHRPRRYSF